MLPGDRAYAGGMQAPQADVTPASMSDALRAESSAIWDALHAHPFLRELADGTLPLDRFRFFIEQDDFYLEDYARCLAMGVARSRNDVELASFTTDLLALIEDELPNNLALLARVIEMGAEDRGGWRMPAPANVAYTSYMHAVAARGDALDITAVLLPCAWSYVEIATALEPAATTNDVYAGWIGFFGSPEVIEMVAGIRRSFDELTRRASLGPERRVELSRIFATSSRMEHAFWEMAYRLEQWPDLETGLTGRERR
jgi:thiaminase/transcriptional activator TenA